MHLARCLAVALAIFLPQFIIPIQAQERVIPKEFSALKYRLVGPFAGGRVSRACGVVGDPLTYYAATASGGVWKSSDAGLTWKSIFDDQPTSSIGSIAVAHSDANVIYVGTGEANIRGNVSPGIGIFKSTDAGKSWKHVWKQIGQIGTMAVHPRNPDIAFAAVLGHAFGPNAERGLYRTINGGKSWERILFKNEDTGCSDIAIDPSNPRIIFAGFWQTRRKPWEMTSGGPGSDFFVSRDGGDSWKSMKLGANNEPGASDKAIPGTGLPKGIWGKVGIAIAPSHSQIIYALIEAESGGLFRSDDGGVTWEKTSEDRKIRQRAWYYSTLTVHSVNPDVLYAPQVNLLESIDAGKNFHRVSGTHHGDHHDLWIDPVNPKRMINANDGGIDITTDGGKSWFAPPLPISQCYHVNADNQTPYRVMACLQDLGSASGPSNSLTGSGIAAGDWYPVGGGEAGFAVPDPSDANIVYAGEYGGIMTRYDHRTRQARNITINQFNPSGIDPAKMKYRFQWTAPILVSSQEKGTIYHGANVLFRSRDEGQVWEAVSPDLTRNDKNKQQWSGGPITGDNTGVEVFGTIFAIAESPKKPGLLWVGSDDGRVHLTQDNCKTWTDVTANIPDLPDWATVSAIEASPHDPASAYLVVDNHRQDDYRPHVWKTTDFGKSWTAIKDGLDSKVHCRAIREDPKKKGLLYIGTERGIHYSLDSGKNWKSLQLNLPTVPVHDLLIKGNDLVLGTHGRSIWILDGLAVVRETSPTTAAKESHLFPVAPATRWSIGSGGPTSAYGGRAVGENPDHGAAIWFYVKDKPKGEVKIEILDAKGKIVAVAKGKAGDKEKDKANEKEDDDEDEKAKERKLEVRKGLNRFTWDMTHDGAATIPGAVVDSGSPGQRVPAAPGKFTVRLSGIGQTLSADVELAADPRWMTVQIQRGGVKAEQAQQFLAEQEKLAIEIRDGISKLTGAVKQIRAVKKQIALRRDLLKDNAEAKDLLAQTKELEKKLDELEEKLHNPKAKITYDVFAARGGAMLYSQFVWLLSNLLDDGQPTRAQRELAVELDKQLADLLKTFDLIFKADLQKLNLLARKIGVPELYIPARK